MLTIDIVGWLGWRDAGNFEESKHPRGNTKNKGQFAKKGSSAAPAAKSAAPKQAAKQSTAKAVEKAPGDPGFDDDIKKLMELRKARRQTRAAHKKAAESGAPEAKLTELKAKWNEAHKALDEHRKMLVKKHGISPYNLPGEKPEKPEPGEKPEPPKVKPPKQQKPLPPPEQPKAAPPPAPSAPEQPKASSPPSQAIKSISPLEKADQAEIAAAVSDKPPDERAYHLSAWGNASKRMAAILAGGPKIKISKGSGHGSFHPMYKVLTMGKGWSGGSDTFRHEYGHAIDYSIDAYQPYSTKYMKEALEEGAAIAAGAASKSGWGKIELPESVKAKTDISPASKSVLENLTAPSQSKLEMIAHSYRSTGSLMDFFGALTLNKVGSGHSNEYYAHKPARRTTEAFANYVTLTEGPHGDMYKAVLHHYAPKTCAGFEQILNDYAKKARKFKG